MMLLAISMLTVQVALGFIALDLLFRVISVEPEGLKPRLKRYRLLYTALAIVCCGGGTWVLWSKTGKIMSMAGAVGWVFWWSLWRFGVRKQFPYLQIQQIDAPPGHQ